jgi:DNA-directed RNA polymerase specialized sigma24 family protein
VSRTLLPEELLSHAAWMRSLARSLVRDDASADDVVQDTFVAVAERSPERPKAVSSWLRGLIFNLVRRSHRSQVRSRRREERMARHECDVSMPADVLDATQREVVGEEVIAAEPYRRPCCPAATDPADIARREALQLATIGRGPPRSGESSGSGSTAGTGAHRAARSAILIRRRRFGHSGPRDCGLPGGGPMGR